MKYNEKELGKFRRKKPLYEIIGEIEDNGIKIEYKKYPEFHTMAILRNIILDYQDLVPGDEPDLTEMTEAVEDFEGFDWLPAGEEYEIEEETELVEPVKKGERTEPDWELIKSIDVTDSKSEAGRERIVTAIYQELLFRNPDPDGMQTYKNCLRDGMSMSNIRDAIRRSNEYKRKHNI
jgi:hypothetical protein